MGSFGTSSRNSPPNEWLCPVARFVKDTVFSLLNIETWSPRPVEPAVASTRATNEERLELDYATRTSIDVLALPTTFDCYRGWCRDAEARLGCSRTFANVRAINRHTALGDKERRLG
jgi:hypothetical protein